MTTFSVLICTYNRSEMLAKSLEALIDGTLEKPDQVVVVNGGDERSDFIVQKYVGTLGMDVRLVKTVNKNLAASRNIGLPHCTGEIVGMTDDDAEVFPDWVTQMKKIHAEHPEAGGVGGAVIGAESGDHLLSRIADVATFSSPSEPGYVRTIAGVNVSYKRAALQAVGLQDEAMFRGEDVDFNWRIKRLGYEIYYHPDIKVLHHHRPDLMQFIYQFYMYGRAYYQVRRKWPDMYCVYPHSIKRFRDVLKIINFILRIFYQPLLHAVKIRPWYLRPMVCFVMFISGSAWSYGVIFQKITTGFKSVKGDHERKFAGISRLP
jgi:GT2 family glycosyltransferase